MLMSLETRITCRLAVDRLGLQEEPPRGGPVAVCRHGDAAGDRFPGGARDHLVEIAARLTRVARDLRHAHLVAVEFLQRCHRDVDVVLLEAEEARRIVHQHVGVEHEQLDGGGGVGNDGGGGLALAHGPLEC
jgi:hypothetical protein